MVRHAVGQDSFENCVIQCWLLHVFSLDRQIKMHISQMRLVVLHVTLHSKLMETGVL
jgi:hypothetical protein